MNLFDITILYIIPEPHEIRRTAESGNWPLHRSVKISGESAGELFSASFVINAVYVRKHFSKNIIFCALHVFLCVLVLRPVCARTRAQLRGNIAYMVARAGFEPTPSGVRRRMYQ